MATWCLAVSCNESSTRRISSKLRPVGDLLARHAQAGIELRVLTDLGLLVEEVVRPGAVGDFSIIRL